MRDDEADPDAATRAHPIRSGSVPARTTSKLPGPGAAPDSQRHDGPERSRLRVPTVAPIEPDAETDTEETP